MICTRGLSFYNQFKFRSTLPESWAANSFKKLHEALGTEAIETMESQNEKEGTQLNDEITPIITNKNNRDRKIDTGNINKKDKPGEEKETSDANELGVDSKHTVSSNAFMQLSYGQKDVCVGGFWEVFCQEAENQGISPASFATFLGARAAIPGPSAPQGAWGQFSSGNRSVLDTFRKLRFGKLYYSRN